jgi:putative transcriptional regulator
MSTGVELPLPLRACEIGPWRSLAPGLRYSSVGGGQRKGARLMLFRAAPGTAMPAHGHGEIEFTCVLSGSFVDKTGRYGPGDMAEATASLDHQPVIEAGTECVSLIAIEGKLRMHNFLGRLVTPLLGI